MRLGEKENVFKNEEIHRTLTASFKT